MTTTHKPSHTRAAGPIECTSWCQDNDGHADALFTVDQWCRSEALSVPIAPYRFPLNDPDMPGVVESDRLDVFASRWPLDDGGAPTR